jgi:hypothetical protein
MNVLVFSDLLPLYQGLLALANRAAMHCEAQDEIKINTPGFSISPTKATNPENVSVNQVSSYFSLHGCRIDDRQQ